MTATTGHRVFLVRQALGPSPRRPLSQEAFAQLLSGQPGARRYYGPEVSLWEQDKKDLTRDDIAVVASVDPLQRGKLWVGWGEDEKSPASGDAGDRFSAEKWRDVSGQAEQDAAEEDAAQASTTAPRKHGGRKR